MNADDAAKQIETFAEETKQAITENMEKASKSFEDFAAFGKDNMDALMAAQNLAAKAAEEINAELVAFSKKTVEEGVAHAKDLSSAQTVTEFLEKQAGFAKLSLEQAMQQSSKMSELVATSAKSVMEPINARMNAAVELFKTQAA